MRALITGGAGFVASNVVGLLLQEGRDIVVLDDPSSGYRESLPSDVAFMEFGYTPEVDVGSGLKEYMDSLRSDPVSPSKRDGPP